MHDNSLDIDGAYTRAKAQMMLGDCTASLETINKVLEVDSEGGNPGFFWELLRFKFDLLGQLNPPGHIDRITAARCMTEFSQSHELVREWVSGEAVLLQELIYAAAANPRQAGNLPIERAERVLAHVGMESDGALRLYCVLISAYSMEAARSSNVDDIGDATSLFLEIASLLPIDDRIVVSSNLLLAWMRIASANPGSRELVETIQELVPFATSSVLESANGARPENTFADEWRSDANEISRTAELYLQFLNAESHGDEAECVLISADLSAMAQWLSSQKTDNVNRSWLVPILYEASAHLLASVGQLSAAEAGYRQALDSIKAPFLVPILGHRIAESLYSIMCVISPSCALCEIAKRDGAAATWTRAVEKLMADDDNILPPAVNQALLAFEKECFEVALKGGWVEMKGAAGAEIWETRQQDAKAALRRAGLPEFDAADCPVDGSSRLRSVATTVVLCSGRQSGQALIVPPGARIEEAVMIPLPDYTIRASDTLLMGRRDGWLGAVLGWRSDHNVASFDTAVRRTSTRLWDCAIGPVSEALSSMGCEDQVDLAVRGDQRLLPWGCASPSVDMNEAYMDRTWLSTGFDLSTLLLGKERANRPRSKKSVTDKSTRFKVNLLLAAPFLGISPDEAMKKVLSTEQMPTVLSITDGTADLPMTRLEGDAVRTAFPESSIHIEGGVHPMAAPFLTGLLETASIIHIACHGVWMPTCPWVSSLMVGPEFALYAATVRARFRLGGALVVLSACESGLGGPSAVGEGSLIQAFLLAGADCVVPTYWMVQDLSSLLFLSAFFAASGRGENVFDAIKTARRSIRNMTQDELGAAVELAAAHRPSVRQELARSFEASVCSGVLPFSSPIHWGAQFVATAIR